MREELLAAIRHGQVWVKSFTRFAYREAFAIYCSRYGTLYTAALAQCDDPESLADGLLDDLAASWKREHFWTRSAARVDDKMALVAYLLPMLLKNGGLCADFAQILCRKWNERWPGNPCGISDYETLLNGFRHSVMGFDLEGKRMNVDRNK